MNEYYKIIGCSNCGNIFYTRAKLVARCPNCAKQIPLYRETKVFFKAETKEIADKIVDKLNKNKRLIHKAGKLTAEELGL